MIKKLLLIVILFASFSTNSNGQNIDIGTYVNNVLPASPAASALNKYIDFPVDYSTGIPSISYNLYTLDIDGLKIPISISYHAGGVKVDDIGTAVGLGWTLNAGGGIFRQINGQPDEYTAEGFLFNNKANASYVYNINNTLDPNAEQVIGQAASNLWDISQDDYSYHFLDKSGTFYFNQNKSVTLSNKENLIIQDSLYTNLGNNLLYFKATDDKGNNYSFNLPSSSSHNTYSTTTGDQHSGSGVTDWMLTEINTPGKRKIDFTYTSYQTSYTTALYDLWDVKGADIGTGPSGICDYTCGTQDTYLALYDKTATHNNSLITGIGSDNIYVQFVYSHAPASNWQTELDSIKVYNASKLVKLIHFDYSLFSGDPRLELIGFENINLVDSSKEVYQFKYRDGASYPLPTTDSRAKDMFGYYNGANSNTTLIYSTDPSYPFLNANRNIDTGRIMNGILTEIVLPTGGKMDFKFQANYLGGGNYMPGVHLQQKTIYDNINNITETDTYKYLNSYGLSAQNGLSVISEVNNNLFYARTAYNSNNYPLNQISGSYYGRQGYIYKNVTEDKISATGEDQRTTYLYFPVTIGKNVRGNLVNTMTYTQNAGQYVLNRNVAASYTLVTIDSLTTANYAVGKGHLYWDYVYTNSVNACCATIYSGIDSIENFTQTMIQKTAETDTVYTNNGTIGTPHNYYYENPKHCYLTRETSVNSQGLLLTNTYQYPMDMVSAGLDSTGVYQDMINRNVVSPVIVSQKFKNGNLLTVRTTQYRSDWLPDKSIIEPSYINQTNAAGQSQEKIDFLQYDLNNAKILQIAKDNDINESFVYDYKNSYLIAHAHNATYSDIAATSFEADGTGNFSFSGVSVADTTAITGSMVYPLSAGTITKSGLSSTTNYLVSYWSKSGSASVNGATVTSILSRNGWNYFEHTISGATLVTISGTVTIDELRLYPVTAQMTTYTYIPLIGLTSQTGIDNRTSYFDYDGLNRLMTSRDQDKNIMKRWNYQYQVNSNASPTLYSNATQSQVYQKNNCPSPATGSKFTYTVVPGTYKSPISQHYVDSLAQAEIAANGQAAADSNGSCSLIFYNLPIVDTVYRQCPTLYIPTPVRFIVLPGIYTSLISQAYVDSLAWVDVTTNAQNYANTYGSCVAPTTMVNVNYSNTATDPMTITFTNTATNLVTSFPLSASVTSSQLAGQILVGGYNISVAPTRGTSNKYNIRVGTSYQSGVNSMQATGITVTGNITVLISPTSGGVGQ